MRRTVPIATRLLALLAIAGMLPCIAQAQQDMAMRVPELDLGTLEAETPEGTFQVRRAEDAFVAEIADGRAIGIAFASEVDIPADEDEIVVRLYDRQRAAVMVGSIDDRGHALLQSIEGSDFVAAVALTVHDDAVTGTVTYGDEAPMSFTAEPASGVAGVYWTLGNEDSEIRSIDWIVLPDGRQWGVICLPQEPYIYFCVRGL